MERILDILKTECPTEEKIHEKLGEATRSYLDKLQIGNEGEALDFYLGPLDDHSILNPPQIAKTGWRQYPLIYYEVACAQLGKGRWPRLDEKEWRTLVLLIGTSFEPLYQAIWAYRPKRLVLLLNENYGLYAEGHTDAITPKAMWENFIDGLKRLPREIVQGIEDRQDLDGFDKKRMCVPDTPLAVYQRLRERLENETKPQKSDNAKSGESKKVIIDITGAKKTMVAGAYLFAAYTGTEISYVDFERYDKGYGRAYGYTCRIGSVDNPIRKLALKEWQTIRRFYEQYDFNAALEMLDHIAAEQRELLGENIDNFRAYLLALRHWEEGQFREANQCKEQLSSNENLKDANGVHIAEKLPSAIADLFDHWPDESKGEKWLHPTIYENPKALIEYAYDELERARWFSGMPGKRGQTPSVQPQARLAFSKAYALHETLICVRAIALFANNAITAFDKSTSERILPTGDRRVEAIETLARMMTGHITGLVVPKNNGRYPHDEIPPWRDYQGIAFSRSHHFDSTSSDYDGKIAALCSSMASLDQKDLRDARNVITHKFVPVSINHAQQAVKHAEKNLNDFIDNWAALLDDSCDRNSLPAELKRLRDNKRYHIPNWMEIKAHFQLNFLADD